MFNYIFSYVLPIIGFCVIWISVNHAFSLFKGRLDESRMSNIYRYVNGKPEDGQVEHIRRISMLKSRGNYNLQTGHYITTSDISMLRRKVYRRNGR